jgi:hypothetical protein
MTEMYMDIFLGALIHIFIIILFEIVLYYTFINNNMQDNAKILSNVYSQFIQALPATMLAQSKQAETSYISQQKNKSIMNSGIILGSIFLITIILIILIYTVLHIKLNWLSILYNSSLTIGLIIMCSMILLFTYLLPLQFNMTALTIRLLQSIKNSF